MTAFSPKRGWPLPTPLSTKKWLLPFLLCACANSACSSSTIAANYSDVTIQPVQIVDAKGTAIGDKTQYMKLTLVASQDLSKLNKALLQFRAYVVLPNGERFLTLGTATVAEKPHHFIPFNRKNQASTSHPDYSVFFFHNLILDYDGNYKINLRKDAWDRIEFDVAYRVFAGPQLARSSTLTVTKADFLKTVAAQKDDAKAVFLTLE